METEQDSKWRGSFGRVYTDRNPLSVEEMETLYVGRYGLSRTELNNRFLSGLDRSKRILEVGCNLGIQLLCLQKMGFTDLNGIDLQKYAVECSKSRTEGINIIEGSAFDIPFKDGFFDLVFTSGVLIHIHPSHIETAMREIHRTTEEFIWGFEYYADEYEEVTYRGHDNMLWKSDFAKLYLDTFEDLKLEKEERIKYLNSGNVDSMFLLRKKRIP